LLTGDDADPGNGGTEYRYRQSDLLQRGSFLPSTRIVGTSISDQRAEAFSLAYLRCSRRRAPPNPGVIATAKENEPGNQGHDKEKPAFARKPEIGSRAAKLFF
jgi:hypothetical protein